MLQWRKFVATRSFSGKFCETQKYNGTIKPLRRRYKWRWPRNLPGPFESQRRITQQQRSMQSHISAVVTISSISESPAAMSTLRTCGIHLLCDTPNYVCTW